MEITTDVTIKLTDKEKSMLLDILYCFNTSQEVIDAQSGFSADEIQAFGTELYDKIVKK